MTDIINPIKDYIVMKKSLMLCLMLAFCLFGFAQATDLVVDCQTPGWLSSKINFGDQQTVKNLKVTGYINATDLKFIGTLIQFRNLDGELDLSECDIISETTNGHDNTLVYLGLSKKDSIRVYRIPKSATEVVNCVENMYVDTLYFDCKLNYINQAMLWYEKMDIGYLHLGNIIDSIPDYAFERNPGRLYAGASTKINSVHLSTQTKYIGKSAFEGSELTFCNFNELVNLEYLGSTTYINGEWHTFGLCSLDTIIIPSKLLNYPMNAFRFKEGTHLFFENKIEVIEGYWDNASITLHMNRSNPPHISTSARYPRYFEGAKVYVPKGAKEAYMASDQWRNSIIIEMNPVEEVTISTHELIIDIGERKQLIATTVPIDADNKNVDWSSTDEQVATVDTKGNVMALRAGEAWVKAISMDNAEAKDSCKVKVLQPVTGISLSQSSVRLTNIGESIQLEATIYPEDASNKEVKWTSSNEGVCIVANGKIIATGFGTAVVIATTVDGGFVASCTVIVEKESVPVTSIDISQTSATMKKGEILQLNAIVMPSDATNKNVIWKSSDESVCVVTQSGLVIAIGEGVSFVVVVPQYGVGQAQCEVTVTTEDAITDIENDCHRQNAPVYDMMGRKVTTLVKGRLYVCNGKKFMAK